MTILVDRSYFSGDKLTYSKAPGGLANVIRGLAQDNARLRLKQDALTQFTNNSGGTSAGYPYPIVDVPLLPSGPTAANGTGSTIQAAAFNTAIGTYNNAHAVIATELNTALTLLGLPNISGLATGTVVTPGTIAALSAFSADNASEPSPYASADYATALSVLTILKGNQRILGTVLYQILTAIGAANMATVVSPASYTALMGMTGTFPEALTLLAPGTALSSAVTDTPASCAAFADAAALTAALEDNISTMAAAWNALAYTAEASYQPLQVIAV